MVYRLASWIVFLHLLLFMFSHGSCQSNKLDPRVLTIDQSDNPVNIEMVVHRDHHHNQHGHPMTHMNHHHYMMDDPLVVVFFTFDDLMVGNTIPIHFPKRDPSSSPHFLPRNEAESLPFSSQELPSLLRYFSFSQQSPQAVAMEETLKDCERNPAMGETKLCVTSLESMLEFASGVLGMDVSDIQSISTIHLTKSNILFQNFTIMDFTEYYAASKIVPCHSMPYPFAVFYCHYQEGENRVFKVLLKGENGDRVEAVAVCHLDTSKWSQSHVAFQVLGTEPGSSSVCHFFPDDHLVWIPSTVPALI
ncbi:BURP domain-containing protein BNM2A-like [Impatiens glandulifera]|uniref:BURP domain-containing protein BNM2A-like n=1 Tax=Impatiens glandulifera TaxID=253017 RepID=UPI001FB0C86C|nr:BURP domain-containing protein BNM2A-like [Impatiens glandulifera]